MFIITKESYERKMRNAYTTEINADGVAVVVNNDWPNYLKNIEDDVKVIGKEQREAPLHNPKSQTRYKGKQYGKK